MFYENTANSEANDILQSKLAFFHKWLLVNVNLSTGNKWIFPKMAIETFYNDNFFIFILVQHDNWLDNLIEYCYHRTYISKHSRMLVYIITQKASMTNLDGVLLKNKSNYAIAYWSQNLHIVNYDDQNMINELKINWNTNDLIDEIYLDKINYWKKVKFSIILDIEPPHSFLV